MPAPHETERERLADEAIVALAAVYAAARADVLDIAAAGRVSLAAIWSPRVTEVVTDIVKTAANAIGALTAEDLNADTFDAAFMDEYLERWGENFGHQWLEDTRSQLDEIAAQHAVDLAAEVQRIMDDVVAAAEVTGRDQSVKAANFGAFEAARSSDSTTKTWHTAVGDNRATHAALNGVTIPLDERFGNGLRYPGAPGPPAETVNCNCYLTFGGDS